jgi:hypothetical protein
MAEAAALNPAQWPFESARAYHAAVAQLKEASDLIPDQCRIVACLRHHFTLLAPDGKASVLHTDIDRVRSTEGAPTSASLVQRQNACSTRKRPVVRFHEDPPTQRSLSSIAERAADNRDTAGRNRQGLPNTKEPRHARSTQTLLGCVVRVAKARDF